MVFYLERIIKKAALGKTEDKSLTLSYKKHLMYHTYFEF